MRVCYQCGYRGPDRACPRDDLPTLDEANGIQRGQTDLIDRVFADRYEIRRFIGAGGMGSVFLARQRSIQQDVALKVLAHDVASNPTIVQRFFREARLSAQLTHPNTIRVFDFGVTDDGYIYIAMEYLLGHTLGSLIQSMGRIPPRRAISIACQICDALDSAHSTGLVHRDLKPENVFITRQGKIADFVKVLDFGIAKELDNPDALTATGLMLGTPRYMSPEQAQGLPLDARSDLYSLGIVLHEMVAGAPPFGATTPLSQLVQHVTEPPLPLPTEIDGNTIPHELRKLVLELLEKSPEDRPPSARCVEERLARIADAHEPPAISEATFNPDQAVSPSSAISTSVVRRKWRPLQMLGFAGAASSVAMAALLISDQKPSLSSDSVGTKAAEAADPEHEQASTEDPSSSSAPLKLPLSAKPQRPSPEEVERKILESPNLLTQFDAPPTLCTAEPVTTPQSTPQFHTSPFDGSSWHQDSTPIALKGPSDPSPGTTEPAARPKRNAARMRRNLPQSDESKPRTPSTTSGTSNTTLPPGQPSVEVNYDL